MLKSLKEDYESLVLMMFKFWVQNLWFIVVGLSQLASVQKSSMLALEHNFYRRFQLKNISEKKSGGSDSKNASGNISVEHNFFI